MTRKPLTRKLVLAAAAAFALNASPAWAQPPVEQLCMTHLMECYYWAAAQDGFWAIWAGGIDCELAMIACVRRALTGY